ALLLHHSNRGRRRMNFKKIFLLCTLTLFAFGMGSPFTLKASESKLIDRIPRTNGNPPDMWTLMELRSIANRYADAAGIPADLVRAVVRVESDWDQSMTGYAGEIGLMQIRPETAREMGFAAEDDDLYRPETNILWGVRYLAEAWRL